MARHNFRARGAQSAQAANNNNAAVTAAVDQAVAQNEQLHRGETSDLCARAALVDPQSGLVRSKEGVADTCSFVQHAFLQKRSQHI